MDSAQRIHRCPWREEVSVNDGCTIGVAGRTAAFGSTWSVAPVRSDAGLRSEKLTAIYGIAGNGVWAVNDEKGIFNDQNVRYASALGRCSVD